jgi:hypothetical protein
MPFLQFPINNCIMYSHTMQGRIPHLPLVVTFYLTETWIINDRLPASLKR